MAKIVFKEDEEIIVPESTKKTIDNDIMDESSDDEAPEAISTSKAKDTILSKVNAEKEAQAKLATEEKEKRRQRDQILKEQKENSKRQLKELEKKAKTEKEAKEFLAREEKRKLKPEPELLPQDLLAQALVEEEEASKKRKHVTAEEFEKMIAEQEAEEAKKAKKRKNTKNGRAVGEYTVKVISNRPKVEKTNKQLRNNRAAFLQRKAVPRKEAVVNISSGRDGAALVFHRKQ